MEKTGPLLPLLLFFPYFTFLCPDLLVCLRQGRPPRHSWGNPVQERVGALNRLSNPANMPLLPVRCSPPIPPPSSVSLRLRSASTVGGSSLCTSSIPPSLSSVFSNAHSAMLRFFVVPLSPVLASFFRLIFLGPEPVPRVSVSRGRLKSRDGEADCSCAVMQ